MRERGERYAPGEAVHLVRETASGYELLPAGTHARVLADHGAVVVLHLGRASAEVVTCPADHVARVESFPGRPVTRAA